MIQYASFTPVRAFTRRWRSLVKPSRHVRSYCRHGSWASTAVSEQTFGYCRILFTNLLFSHKVWRAQTGRLHTNPTRLSECVYAWQRYQTRGFGSMKGCKFPDLCILLLHTNQQHTSNKNLQKIWKDQHRQDSNRGPTDSKGSSYPYSTRLFNNNKFYCSYDVTCYAQQTFVRPSVSPGADFIIGVECRFVEPPGELCQCVKSVRWILDEKSGEILDLNKLGNIQSTL